MKRIAKIFSAIGLISFVLIFIGIISFGLLLEPDIKISGFIEMNPDLLTDKGALMEFQDGLDMPATKDATEKIINYSAYDDISPMLIKAFVAIEDKRFYSHHGVDYIRILGALLSDIKKGHIVEGGSTITQQLVKNTHLNANKTLKRKIQEIRIAKQVERNYSKKEIMEMYLNNLYFGNNIYGIGMAAEVYFGCTPNKLALSQCAILAAIINNPLYYNPYSNPENLIKRRNVVLERMRKLNFISENEYYDAIQKEMDFISEKRTNNHFYEFAYDEFSQKVGIRNPMLLKNKMIVKTTLNPEFQKEIETVIDDNIVNSNQLTQCVLVENKTGKVLAYAGFGRRKYIDCYRQLGSTVKPFVCYAPALEKKLISPATPINDEPTVFEGKYSPGNYRGEYRGWISVREALIQSSNVCAVKLLEMADPGYSSKIARASGIKLSAEDEKLTLALGVSHKGNRLIEIVNAYQMLGNGGRFIPCSFIQSIKDDKGKVLYEYKPVGRRVLDEGNAYLLNDMLSDCVKRGTAKKLRSCEYAVAAKTGTVGNKNGNTDAYCIVYGSSYTLAVWCGAKEGLMPNEISGGTLPADIALEILNKLKLDLKAFDKPENIIELNFDRIEYEKNHKIVLGNGLIPPREIMSGLFHINNLPHERSKRKFPQYILRMDELYFDNFKVI